MLTDIWYKDALLIKKKNIWDVWAWVYYCQFSSRGYNVDESSQSPFLLFVFFTKKHQLRPAEVNRNVLSDHIICNYPLSCCVSPPVPPSCAIYARCHPSRVTTNAEQQPAETVSTF